MSRTIGPGRCSRRRRSRRVHPARGQGAQVCEAPPRRNRRGALVAHQAVAGSPGPWARAGGTSIPRHPCGRASWPPHSARRRQRGGALRGLEAHRPRLAAPFPAGSSRATWRGGPATRTRVLTGSLVATSTTPRARGPGRPNAALCRTPRDSAADPVTHPAFGARIRMARAARSCRDLRGRPTCSDKAGMQLGGVGGDRSTA